MDEPLSNLDAKLRVQTRTQIASLQRRLGITTVYVTHDQVEAMTMGDRVAVLKDGLLQQCDTPRAMYEKPANVFVAGFIGSPAMNLVEVPIVEEGVKFDGLTIPVSRDALGLAAGGGAKTLTVGVRPESFDFVGDAEGAIAVTVHLVEELGADAFAYCAARVGDNDVDLIVRVDARAVPMKGDTLYVKPRASETHLFSASSGERIEA
jgi:multiple sugar transport system ATP-binding protein